MKSRVSLVRCADYEPQRVYEAVQEALDLLGGMSAFVQPGQRVLLQPNLISPRPPQDAVCTHPLAVSAVCRLVREAGATPIVGGSSGGSAYRRTQHVLRTSGIAAAAEETGAEVLSYDDEPGIEVKESLTLFDSLTVAKAVREADVVINLPKMKTHTLTLLTGAVKNMLSALPGARKAELHRRYPEPRRFAEALVDIWAVTRPSLNIMDAVEGMEGDGPTAGRKRQVGLVAASADGVALDSVMCAVCGLNLAHVHTAAHAARRGLGVAAMEDIDVLGAPLAEAMVRPFAYPMTMALATQPWMRPWLYGFLVKRLSGAPEPVIVEGKCNRCQLCIRSCPVEAMSLGPKAARIDRQKCISCFCCQELCVQQAVEVKLPLIWRTTRA